MWTRTLWWKEENWPVPKKALERQKNTEVNGVCDEDNILLMTVNNCLQRIGSKPIKFENAIADWLGLFFNLYIIDL